MKKSKELLRNKYRTIRASVKSIEKDSKIFTALINSEYYRNADIIFTYYSVRSEVDTVKLINRALKDGKKVALPKCTDCPGNMEFYFVNNISQSVSEGIYSLMEPDASVCIPASLEKNSICIVPGLSFDSKGYRLGYGGGYYDKFLSSCSVRTVGLCYDECFCDELPHDEYDIKVDIILTEDKIYEIK